VTGRLHSAALALAARGCAVFPCVERGKTPATVHGVLDATVDANAISAWWGANASLNIGVATGAASGLFIVDVDAEDGEASLRKLEAEYGALPATVEVITGNGRHVYLRMPPDTEIRNSASRVAPNVDIRATGGYVLVPPSMHPSGRRYAWSVDSASTIADAPAWLVNRIQTDSVPCATPPSEWAKLAADGVGAGMRNDSVARLTGHLLRHYVDPRVVLELVRAWNGCRCRPPLSDAELEQTVQSIAGRELQRRQEAGANG
jgi:hypothetical protein